MRGHEKSWPALIVPAPALIVPLIIKRFSNKLAPNILNKLLRNPTFCSFALFSIVLLTSLINEPDFSRRLFP